MITSVPVGAVSESIFDFFFLLARAASPSSASRLVERARVSGRAMVVVSLLARHLT